MRDLSEQLRDATRAWPVPPQPLIDLMIEAADERDTLREALGQCAEYFDDCADVDTSDGEPVANKEMRLLGVVREALGEK
jgi:hypothetical protein